MNSNLLRVCHMHESEMGDRLAGPYNHIASDSRLGGAE